MFKIKSIRYTYLRQFGPSDRNHASGICARYLHRDSEERDGHMEPESMSESPSIQVVVPDQNDPPSLKGAFEIEKRSSCSNRLSCMSDKEERQIDLTRVCPCCT